MYRSEFSPTRKYPYHNADDKDDAGKKSETALIEAAALQNQAKGGAAAAGAVKQTELNTDDLLAKARAIRSRPCLLLFSSSLSFVSSSFFFKRFFLLLLLLLLLFLLLPLAFLIEGH